MSKTKVFAKLPSAGLGNLLIVWAQGLAFAKINKLPFITSGWNQVHIGPWLRGEKRKRFYGNLIKQDSFLSRMNTLLQLKSVHTEKVLSNPEIIQLPTEEIAKYSLVLFSKVPHWSDFTALKEHKGLIKEELYSIVKKKHLKRLAQLQAPEIGIHIRLSDFKESTEGGATIFTAGAIRTPMSYFIDKINEIRKQEGSDLKVTVFSDGHEEELNEILSLKNTTLSKKESDIVDMLLLSKSKYIIPSAKSTFSYWSAFISDATIIFHPCHLTPPF